MNLAQQLEKCLTQEVTSQEKGLRIRDWRFFVHEAQSLSLGIKENSTGSVYTPPSHQQGQSGEVYIIWEDGLLSQAYVQTPGSSGTQEYWQAKRTEWRQGAYEDPEAAGVPEPARLPVVQLEDPAIKRILDGEDQVLFDTLASMLKAKPVKAQLNAGIHAVWGLKHYRNSRGLAVSYPETQYVRSFSLDNLLGGGFAKRRLNLPEEWEATWNRILGYYEAFQKEGAEITPATKVIFAPGVLEDLLEQFILPNFSGQGILEGQSAFQADRFKQREQVFREDISLTINPLQPFELGSYGLTPEGVAAKASVLVREGRLETPILRLKESRRWGAEPTGVVSGISSVQLEAGVSLPWEEMLSQVEDGLLVLSVLGMHTQNSVTGDYSLSAPQSLRIEKGTIVGRRPAKLYGNFFRDLANPETRFAKADFINKPYLMVSTGVQTL